MGVSAAAVERQQQFRDARGPGAIVFDPVRLRQADARLLDPAHYGAAAQPVQQGGRGSAWFVRGEFGEGVLRHYRRGGLVARISRDGYVWTGEAGVRSVAEFRLLSALRAEGLPVPVPLAAGYWRQGLVYRAALLVERIPDVRTLAQCLQADVATAPWEAVGRMLAGFHAAGVDHADLNADNILIDAQGAPWLIDFDRSRRRRTGEAWRRANLARLSRSLAKLSPVGVDWRGGMSRLVEAYQARLQARST
ncbi:3-deoxy-D-manno-octulosonic acid kinase [Arenimonas sp. MALMAid1274]|uniref:3-deoxy-D-manno-octulosonic acid kinase n=1 Tax=Arenimonas sp. MALMAid1274 TaxID=3411630 RepID=UPI003B9FE349